MLRVIIALLVMLVAGAPLSSIADDGARSSEYKRLIEQITNYAERNAWPAVARTFLELEALEDDPLTPADLFLGAQAARALGDAHTCQQRLLRAFEKNISGSDEFDPRASRWLGELQQFYGRVDIRHRGNDAVLRAAEPPFQSDRKAAIDFASAELAKNRRFDGLIPAGTYVLGEHTFEVEAQMDSQRVRLRVRE